MSPVSVTYRTTHQICEALHKAGLLESPETVQRVIIDLKYDSVPIIYVTRIGDDRLLDVIVSSGIEIVDNSQ